MANRTTGYKLRYNNKGRVVPPQTTDMPLGLLTAYLAFAFPFVIAIPVGSINISPLLLQYAPTFHVFETAGLLSARQIAELELCILAYLVARFSIFPAFRKKCVSQFSMSVPPPIELKQAWPKQFIFAIKFGATMILIALTVGVLAKVTHSLSLKCVVCAIGLLGVGLIFITEGVMDFGLYVTMRRKYWRS